MNSTPPSCPLSSWTCPAVALPHAPSTVPQTRRTSLPASQVMHAGEVLPAITRAALLAPLSSPPPVTAHWAQSWPQPPQRPLATISSGLL